MLKRSLAFLLVSACIFITIAYCSDDGSYSIQEPKSDTMELVSFTPQKVNFPFEIKYPSKWYAREDTAGMIGLFLTREPVKSDTDKYEVGVSLLYSISYFSERESSESALGKTADFVVKVRDWESSKKQFVEGLKEGGNTVISKSDIKVSGQPTLRVEFESKNAKVTTIYVKAGTHLLVMTLEAPPQEYEKYKDVFEKILNSFFFTR